MEQEQILSEMKTRLGQTSFEDRTLTTYIEKHAPGETPDEAYFNNATDFFKSLQGEFNHKVATKVSEQANTKIEEFKKNYKPTTAGTKVETPPKGDDELQKRLETLEKAYNDEKKANAANSVRSEVKSKAIELKVANKAIWNDVTSTIELKDDVTSEDLLEQVKKTYEKKLKEYTGEGATPYGGSQREGVQQVSTEEAKAKIEAFKKKKQGQGRLPKEV